MGVVVHRCQGCGHWVQEHRAERCSFGYCRCNESKATPGPSEIVETFLGSGRPAPGVITPGEPLWGALDSRVDTCACDECVTLAEANGWTWDPTTTGGGTNA